MKAVQKAYGTKIKTFVFDDVIVPGISALSATGHTPGHTVFLLTSGDEKQVGTATMIDPRTPLKIIQGITEWMSKEGI